MATGVPRAEADCPVSLLFSGRLNDHAAQLRNEARPWGRGLDQRQATKPLCVAKARYVVLTQPTINPEPSKMTVRVVK